MSVELVALLREMNDPTNPGPWDPTRLREALARAEQEHAEIEQLKAEHVNFWDTMHAIAVKGCGLPDPLLCEDGDVPKEWKRFASVSECVATIRTDRDAAKADRGKMTRLTNEGANGQILGSPGGNDVWMQRLGKKVAGRLLDGREWNEVPEMVRV